MTRALTRKQFKQFAGSAVLADVDKFGSVAAGAAVTSLDPDVIQILGAWATGWKTAVMTNKSPIIEDMNAVDFVFAYMLACIFEEGIPDWETNTTYSTGSIVNDGAGNLYVSLADANAGNPLSSSTKWKLYRPGALNPQTTSTLALRATTTWTGKAAANNAININGLCWSPELGLFCAVGNTDTSGVAVSTDGSTWTGKNAAANVTWSAVCWSPELGLFCAVAANGANRAMTSPDGTTWTAHAVAEANTLGAICWSPELGIFLALSIDGTHRVQYSADGATWVTATAAAVKTWQAVCWSPQLLKFVAVSTDGAAMFSSDGIVWTSSAVVPEANQWESVCWSSDLGIFVAVAATGTNRVMYSRDGNTWVVAAAAEANAWFSVDWSAELGLFVAVSQGGTHRVMTSPDGATWTARTASSAKTWNRIAWSPKLGLFAAGSADGGGAATGMMVSKYVQKFIAP